MFNCGNHCSIRDKIRMQPSAMALNANGNNYAEYTFHSIWCLQRSAYGF